MKTAALRWRPLRGDIDPVVSQLHPIRSCEEVARMLGLSVTRVRQIEKSALRKIMSALARLEHNFKINSETDPNHE